MNALLAFYISMTQGFSNIIYELGQVQVLLRIIIAIMAFDLALRLYDRFKVRERLVKIKGWLKKREFGNLDQRLINFFDNR
jgi:hypothetical protein